MTWECSDVDDGYFSGRVVVITGAGAGIGRAVAVRLARDGARLVLWDTDAVALQATAETCRSLGADVRLDVLDVRDGERLAQCARAASEQFGGLDVLVCLAGVIHTGRFLASRLEDYRDVMEVNYWGTVNTVRACLPLVIASGGGQVVTTSSAFGLAAVARYGAYSASKFAIRGFTEALAQEMAMDDVPVRVSCVYPGGVRTGIIRAGRFADDEDAEAVVSRFDQSVARSSAEDAAEAIAHGIARGRARILVGADARAVSIVARLAAGSYPRVLGRLFRRHEASGRMP